jgi:hypothetical protein
VTGLGFGDIEASMSRLGGAFTPAQNLTNTPQTDERFVAISPNNPGGRVGILFQASATNEAGIAESQDRGLTPTLYVRRIAWLERRVTGSLVAVDDAMPALPRISLAASPNPAREAVHFVSDGVADGAVLLFGVDGRRVARVPLVQGRSSWDGRDTQGRRAPAGIYFARIEGQPQAAVKFMLMQ